MPETSQHCAAPRKLFVQRERGRRFVGETRDDSPTVLIYVHSDGGGLFPVDKREIVGAALWDTREVIRAAAEASGRSFDEMAAYVNRVLPDFLRTNSLSGFACPDLTENAADGDRSSGPLAA